MVSALKRASSAGMRQGIALLRPMTRLRLIATMSAMRGGAVAMPGPSDRDRRLDRGVRVVAGQLEILVAEGEQIPDLGVELHPRQRARLARELLARLLEVIEVQMRVAEGVNEFP